MNIAFRRAEAKLGNIVKTVEKGHDPNKMWQSVLTIQVFQGKYELFFNCGNNCLSKIAGELGQDELPVSARYEYRDAGTRWGSYSLEPHEQQAILNFGLALKDYIRPVIVTPNFG